MGRQRKRDIPLLASREPLLACQTAKVLVLNAGHVWSGYRVLCTYKTLGMLAWLCSAYPMPSLLPSGLTRLLPCSSSLGIFVAHVVMLWEGAVKWRRSGLGREFQAP